MNSGQFKAQSKLEVGQVFDRLTVTELLGVVRGNTSVIVTCECGTEKMVRQSHLLSGLVKSCGCGKICEHVQTMRSEGMKHHPLYGVWNNMMNRCYYPNCKSYKDYGGRGIKVHEAWHSAKTFIEQVPPKPEGDMLIDRIENDGNYEPGNVRWVTKAESNRNTRRTVWINYKGERRAISDVATELGVSSDRLRKVRRTHGDAYLENYLKEIENKA